MVPKDSSLWYPGAKGTKKCDSRAELFFWFIKPIAFDVLVAVVMAVTFARYFLALIA